MSKELADRLEQWLKWTILNRQEKQLLNEAIAALRSETVAEVKADERAVSGTLHWRPNVRLPVGTKLYAAPSRETATEVPVHSKSQYKRVAAQGGNPVPSRETDQRSEAAQVNSADGNDAASQSRYKQYSEPPSRTDRQEPELSAEQIEAWRRRWLRMYRTDVKEDAENIRQINKLCDMARRSRTAPINTPNGDRQELIDKCLDAGRDEGIEAAAKLYDSDDWLDCECNEVAAAIRARKGASHD